MFRRQAANQDIFIPMASILAPGRTIAQRSICLLDWYYARKLSSFPHMPTPKLGGHGPAGYM